MKPGRKVIVPAENRRVTTVPPSAKVSQLKFATVADNLNAWQEGFQSSINATVDSSLIVADLFILTDVSVQVLGLRIELGDDALALDDSLGFGTSYHLAVSDVGSQDDSILLGFGYQVSQS